MINSQDGLLSAEGNLYDFIMSCVEGTNTKEYFSFGMIPESWLEQISKKVEYNLSGFEAVLFPDKARHIAKKHIIEGEQKHWQKNELLFIPTLIKSKPFNIIASNSFENTKLKLSFIFDVDYEARLVSKVGFNKCVIRVITIHKREKRKSYS